MKILSIDSSAKTASVAITEDNKLLSECFVNASLTHSRTLMPMVENALAQADIEFDEIDAFAVNVGPGSFTGIRIGVAAVKGLALSQDKHCAGISTLESMAYAFLDDDCIVCGAMDARCGQVYNALFRCENGNVTRLCEDRAISVAQLIGELENFDEKVYLAGDGAELCFNAFETVPDNIKLSSGSRRYQRAFGTALAANNDPEKFRSSALLTPVYFRLPQAERELKLRKGEKI